MIVPATNVPRKSEVRLPQSCCKGSRGPIQRWFASTGTVSSRGLFAIYPRIFTATNRKRWLKARTFGSGK